MRSLAARAEQATLGYLDLRLADFRKPRKNRTRFLEFLRYLRLQSLRDGPPVARSPRRR